MFLIQIMGNVNYGLEANCRPLLEASLGLAGGCTSVFTLASFVYIMKGYKDSGFPKMEQQARKFWFSFFPFFVTICSSICFVLFVISQTVGGLQTKCNVSGQTHMGDDGNWYNGTGTRVSGLFQNGTGTISRWNSTGNGFDWINSTTIAIKPTVHAEAISSLVFLIVNFLMVMGYIMIETTCLKNLRRCMCCNR